MVDFWKRLRKSKRGPHVTPQPKEATMPDEPFVPFGEQQKHEAQGGTNVEPSPDPLDPQPTPDAWGGPNEDYQVLTARVLRETDTASRLLFTYAEHEQRLWIDHADIFEPAVVIGQVSFDVKCAVKIATLKAKGVIPVEE